MTSIENAAYTTTIGERLQQIRYALGFSIFDFSEALQVMPETIDSWEGNEVMPNDEVLAAIAEKYKLDIEVLKYPNAYPLENIMPPNNFVEIIIDQIDDLNKAKVYQAETIDPKTALAIDRRIDLLQLLKASLITPGAIGVDEADKRK